MRPLFLAGLATIMASPALAFVSKPVSSATPFERTVSGIIGQVTWQARSLLVGQTSTATLAAGGDPIYLPSRPHKNGLAFLEINFPGLGIGYCSGSLLPDGQSILTAAHCVSFGGGVPYADVAKVYFYKGPGDPFYDLNYSPANPDFALRSSASIHVAAGYSGSVIDHHDVAIIRLSDMAPDWATRYELAAVRDLTGVNFTIAGFGDRGPSGDFGATFLFGRLREGDNRFDFRLGDPDFGGAWRLILGEPLSRISHSWLSDFDRSGSSVNDASCKVAVLGFGLAPSGKYCDTGRGAREVGAASGDSGGPQFVDGRIVSVTSYGMTFKTLFGDVDDFLNSTFGEFTGYAPLWLHRRWIESLSPGAFGAPIPEPGTWAMLITGFGLVGVAARRRREVTSA